MRDIDIVEGYDSLGRAARIVRDSPFGVAAFLDQGRIIGILTETSLWQAVEKGHDLGAPSRVAITTQFSSISPLASTENAEALFRAGHRELIVLSEDGRPLGIVTPLDLIPKPPEPIWPGVVGGMATPFGVYLTNGSIRAGASDVSLVITGMLMFTLFFGCATLSDWVLTLIPGEIPDTWANTLVYGLPTVLFGIGLRLLPLSGIHAAEHQVVHAIERGEELTPEVVGRMPRVHPRCGTNLAVGLALFSGLLSAEWLGSQDVRLLVAALVTLFMWRPLGSLAQLLITTRPPNAKQVQLGVNAGRELIEKFRVTGNRPISPFGRLIASGMLHVIAGSFICFGIIQLLAWIFKIPVDL